MNSRIIPKGAGSPVIPLLPLIFFSACAGQPVSDIRPPEQSAFPAPERPSSLPEDPGNGLNTVVFQGLPREARDYLIILAQAFRHNNRDFLLAQGEAQFEREARPFYDEDVYLALLYRIEPYGDEFRRQDTVMPRFSPEPVSSITYTGWEETGPLLEIRGRITRDSGEILFCRIMLVWRLREPKILGRFP